jgi:hypothetical protein
MARSAISTGFPNPNYVTELGSRDAILPGTFEIEQGARSATSSATIGNLTLAAAAAAIDNAALTRTIAAHTLAATGIPVGNNPVAFGVFMQPERTFAGTPGHSNCYGKSVSALVRQYHGLHAAASALGFSSIRALETAILAFCEGCRPTTHGHDCD